MGQWSGGTPSQRSVYAPSGQSSPAPPFSGTPLAASPTGNPTPRSLKVAAVAVVLVLVAAVAGLAIAYAGARSNLNATRSALRASRAQLAAVQGALSGDTRALQAEQTVGVYLRGVRDALAPALAAYGASSNANSAASARANDEQAIAALTSAKQKISALALLDALRPADGDIRSAMDALAGGLQSEVTAIGTGNLGGLDAALTIEGQALDHLQTAVGEMYAAVGTTGPASGTS